MSHSPRIEPADGSPGPALYDFETDEDDLAAPERHGRRRVRGARTRGGGGALPRGGGAHAEEPASGSDQPFEEPGTAVRPALEDEEPYEGGTLDPEESYEEEEGEEGLWFEKGPPQDFDFDE